MISELQARDKATVCFVGRSCCGGHHPLIQGEGGCPCCREICDISNLHRAHQGQTNMLATAEESLCWPGLGKVIAATLAACSKCTHEAPSQ